MGYNGEDDRPPYQMNKQRYGISLFFCQSIYKEIPLIEDTLGLGNNIPLGQHCSWR